MPKFTATLTSETKVTKTAGTLLTDVAQIPNVDANGEIDGVITGVERAKEKNRETGKITHKFKFTIQVVDEDGEEMNIYLRTNCRITGKKFQYKDGSMKYSKLVRFLQALEIVPLELAEKDAFQFDLTQLVSELVHFKLTEENGYWNPEEESFRFLEEAEEEDSGED